MDLIKKLQNLEEIFWLNEEVNNIQDELDKCVIKQEEIQDASSRLKRFAPFFTSMFDQTKITNGIIESPLVGAMNLKQSLQSLHKSPLKGDLFLKLDSHLPISGSIKARGGIYEVIFHAEKLLLENNLLSLDDDYSKINSDKIKNFLSKYSIAVGSTGNLGLSIGIMSAKLGFKVSVHMSSDAREWKKKMLRSYGVHVVEYDSDYSVAVAQGREEAQNDKLCHFVDDENSKSLFLGYSVAAQRIYHQLRALEIEINEQNPLFVYLPCGVGGGPGGVAFGLKSIFKDNVKCFFAEPTHSPCMLLGLYTKKHDKISVNDIGLDNKTAADGLAVGRASALVGKVLEHMLDGAYTISDENMYKYLALTNKCEHIALEPSALAGISGILWTNEHLKTLAPNAKNITHVAWATGGSMVPKEQMEQYITMGEKFL